MLLPASIQECHSRDVTALRMGHDGKNSIFGCGSIAERLFGYGETPDCDLLQKEQALLKSCIEVVRLD